LVTETSRCYDARSEKNIKKSVFYLRRSNRDYETWSHSEGGT